MTEGVAPDAVAGRVRAGAVAHPDLVALIDERAARKRQQQHRGGALVLAPEAVREAPEVVVRKHPGRRRAGPAAQRGGRADRTPQDVRVPGCVQQLEHEQAVEMLQVGSGARGRQVDLADQQGVVARCLAQRRERPVGPGRVARVATGPGPARAPSAAGRRARRTAGRRAAPGPSRAGRSHRGGSRPPRARSRTAPRSASPPRRRACASRGRAARDRRSAGTSARWKGRAPRPARRRPTSSCSAARRPSRPRCTSRDARGTRRARSRCGTARGPSAGAGRASCASASSRSNDSRLPSRGSMPV